MAKPQVLVFIDWYLPGYKAGGPVRSMANLVEHLRDRVDFHIVTSDTEYTEHRPYADITPDQWSTLPGGERVWYASAKGTRMAVWKQLLGERDWTSVYVNGIYSRWYSILPLFLLRGTNVRRIVAVRGMLADGPMRHGRFKKRLFLAWARLFGLFYGVHFQATNPQEADDIKRRIAFWAQVDVVPNLPRKAALQQPTPPSKLPGTLRLVSVARIALEKNTHLAIESLARVRGQVEFHLYGPVYDQAYWARCRESIARLPEGMRVEYHGALPPEQVPSMLAGHHALYMPSSGENFGHTMLEALCAGVPLLVSDRTPWRNLAEDRAGWDLPLDDPGAFAQVIQQLVDMDGQAHAAWSRGAFMRGTRYLADTAPVQRTLQLLTG